MDRPEILRGLMLVLTLSFPPSFLFPSFAILCGGFGLFVLSISFPLFSFYFLLASLYYLGRATSVLPFLIFFNSDDTHITLAG